MEKSPALREGGVIVGSCYGGRDEAVGEVSAWDDDSGSFSAENQKASGNKSGPSAVLQRPSLSITG